MKPTPELIRLVDQCLAGKISRVENARLEELLSDENALQYYLEIAGVEGALPLALEAGVLSPVGIRKTAFLVRWRQPLALASAAVVVFCSGLFLGRQPASLDHRVAVDPSEEVSAGAAAAITSLIGVTWDGDAPDSIKVPTDGDAIAFKSGLVELTFASGVRSLIEGPAVVRVTGANAAALDSGRMVADVPKGAEGFTVDYPEGRVIDLGTEFAINVPQNQKGAEVGVFRGEVEVYDHVQNRPLKILENHAVIQTSGLETPFASVPFDREAFIRELPSREFPWKLPETSGGEAGTLEFDVSHLVWKSGDYRAVIKWMQGRDALVIRRADLLLDGELIASDVHTGRTGLMEHTEGNTYTFSVDESQHRKGRWSLRVTCEVNERPEVDSGSFSPDSSGILLFEDSASIHAHDSSFLGVWEYRHDGDVHRRIFTSDHRAQHFLNGELTPSFVEATWRVDDGILILDIPAGLNGEDQDYRELHLLRSDQEMIFINHPYRNAIRVR